MAEPVELVEISDLVRGWAPDGSRSPIRRSDVVLALAERGQRRAARIAARLPTDGDDWLDLEAVDALMLRVHAELQRLGEELHQGRRTAAYLLTLADRLGPGPLRVVDVGCGLGHVVRWLAANDAVGPDVELVGVDLDRTLIASATALAAKEQVSCRFVAGDALAPGGVVADPARTVLVSSGLLHHLRGDRLREFLQASCELGVAAFAHWDPVPGWWPTLGARVFHQARMREPLARHDGVVSVRRAHTAATLLAAADHPAYDVSCADPAGALTSRVLRPLAGVRR
ncbi:class I SAM-dependent methyltransferase [Nocardioides sp. BYT-33-1]|uniref:class I SAM-dependent methyltransferase n=1 Tax=Nocardioides sp. BYT-33-1 TaxID=3416952 RepID=UPI003F52BCC6